MSEVGLILIVSEQILPAVKGIWQVKESGRNLTKIRLLHSSADKESLQPAKQVQKLCEMLLRTVETRLEPTYTGTGKGITPEEVAITVTRIRELEPEQDWLVNATGGLKLMTIGVMNALKQDESATYSEITGEWFLLTRQGQLLQSAPLPRPSPHLIDTIPVASLVAAQFGDSDRFIHVPSALELAKIPELRCDLVTVTERLIQSEWNWRAAMADYITPKVPGGKPDSGAGTLFEKYLVACLLELGIENLAWSLNTRLQVPKDPKEPREQDFNENDIVLLHNGVVTILDLKLPDEKVTNQVRPSAETGRRLGGLAARWVMVRPCKSFEADEREMAAAYRITFFDRKDAPELLYRLAQYFRVPFPSSLEPVQALLKVAPNPFATPAVSPLNPEVRLGDCLMLGEQRLAPPGQNWWLVSVDQFMVFQVAATSGSAEAWTRWLQRYDPSAPSPFSHGSSWRFTWQAQGGRKLGGALRPFVGKSVHLDTDGALRAMPPGA